MYPCNKCLENNWKFEYLDGYIMATCQECGFEAEFIAKEKKVDMQEGDVCKKCNGKILLKECKFKPSKLRKPYYYTALYRCENCKTIYMSDKFKVYNKLNK